MFFGTIKSASDSSSVEYADIYLSGKTIGTISNSGGEFEIKIPDSLAIDDLLISSVGYKTKSIALKKKSLGTIYLEPQTMILKEVVVTANRVDSSFNILKLATQFIKYNYPRKNHLIEGFFRATSIRDTICTRLIEAAIRVQEGNYTKDAWDDENLEMVKNRVKVVEIRKSDDKRKTDFFLKALTMLLGERNDLYQTLGSNYVRLIGKKGNHIMSMNNLAKYNSELLGKIELDGNTVYVITFTDHRDTHFQWSEINLFVNVSDFAIVRVELQTMYNPNRKEIAEDRMIESKYIFKSEVSYRKINHKYYPVYIHSIGPDGNASHTVELGEKKQTQFAEKLFLLTNVYENDFSKIKWKDAEKRDKDLYGKDDPYNEKFWENYNMVKLNPLKRSTKELEKNSTLTQQFKKGKEK